MLIFKSSLLYIIFFILSFTAQSQYIPQIKWQKSIGGSSSEFPTGFIKTSSGTFLISCRSESNDNDCKDLNYGMSDIVVFEIDQEGNIINKKNFGGSFSDAGGTIIENDDGTFLLFITSPSNNYDFQGFGDGSKSVVFKLDKSLNIITKRVMWFNFIEHITGIGNNRHVFSGDSDLFILNEDLSISFAISYRVASGQVNGYSASSYPSVIFKSKYNKLYTGIFSNAGLTNTSCNTSFAGGTMYLASATDTYQDIWKKCYPESINTQGVMNSISELNSGNLVLGADIWPNTTSTEQYRSSRFIKIDTAGNVLQSKYFFTTNVVHYTQTKKSYYDGKWIVSCGNTSDVNIPSNNNLDPNLLVYALDTSLNLKWQKRFGGSLQDEAYSILPTDDGGILSLGYSNSNDGDVSGNHGSYDLWLVKIGVDSCKSLNVFEDTIRSCSSPITLDAGSGYSNYQWNTGETTQTVKPSVSGFYKVTVTNDAGCSASDSSMVSIVRAKILQRDTTICKGASITLAVDSTTSSTNSNLPSNLRNGLIAYYPFNGNANDESGNGNNGTVNGASLTTDRFGNNNSAYSLNGSSYIDVGNLNLGDINKSYTYSGWFKTSSTGDKTLMSDYNQTTTTVSGDDDVFAIITQVTTNGTFIAEMRNYPSSYTTNSKVIVNDNVWHQFITIYDRNVNKLKLYIDGNYLDSLSIPHGINFNSNSFLRLGIHKWNATFQSQAFWDGQIDDICIWNRVLNASEVAQIHSSLAVNWSNGAATKSITVTPAATTKYFVTVSDGITSCQDSITVTVASVDTSITLLDNPKLCSNLGPVRIQAGNAQGYQWLKDGVVISGATQSLLAATTSGSYSVVVTNALGCSDTSRAVLVEPSAKPSVNFTINTSPQCLASNNFIFTNTSSINPGTMSYTWEFGDGASTTTPNSSHTYLTSNTYAVKLKAVSDLGCVDSTTKQITVLANPSQPIISSSSNEFCTGNTLQLTTSGNPSLLWYRNSVAITNATNASLTISQSGDYYVISSAGNGCTATSATKTITENPLPTGVLSVPTSTAICEGTPTTLSASGATSYQWYFNSNIINGATSATYSTSQPGIYAVDFISNKGCVKRSTNSITLTLVEKPVVDFNYTNYCAGINTLFNNTSTTTNSGTVDYAWDFGNGASSALKNPLYTYTTSGSYTVNLSITPTACLGLKQTATKLITVQAPVKGVQYEPVYAILNKPLGLTSRDIGISYLWSPSSDLNNPLVSTPTITATASRVYKISITNAAGCITVDTQVVKIFRDIEIYVPKAFTPDNDGHNDRLYPIPVGIVEMTVFRVFNRSGVMVYDNKAANASTGWDGTFKGRAQPMDTYTWVAEGISIEGVSIRRSGNTVLIR